MEIQVESKRDGMSQPNCSIHRSGLTGRLWLMLRIYSPEQMKDLTQDLQASDYVWEIGQIRVRGIVGGLPYLIGRPLSLP